MSTKSHKPLFHSYRTTSLLLRSWFRTDDTLSELHIRWQLFPERHALEKQVAQYIVESARALFRIGHKIKLTDKMSGIVRFVGRTHFSGKHIGRDDEEFVGVDLGRWHPNVNSGTVDGVEYIKSAGLGRGLFLYPDMWRQTQRCRPQPGSFARLHGLVQVKGFNGRLVQCVEYVVRKQRWKVKLVGSSAAHKSSLRSLFSSMSAPGTMGKKRELPKYLGVRSCNLSMMFKWEIKEPETTVTMAMARDVYLGVGDRVRDKYGYDATVKFVGVTDFSNAEVWVGLEMDHWNVNYHDGSVSDKRYFSCQHGHGCIVPLQGLVK